MSYSKSDAGAAASDAADDDEHGVVAPPVGLRGLLQQKDSSGPSASLSNVGAIYGDIQRALVNFPRALQVHSPPPPLRVSEMVMPTHASVSPSRRFRRQ
jgi:hypothetical protein